MAQPRIPLDPPIRPLVRALNSFAGIRTIGSCGGHPAPLKGGQWEEGTWYVTFRVDRSDDGWFALEFLAWAINHDHARGGGHVTVVPTAPAPYLNGPGTVLRFALEGYGGEDPLAFAAHLAKLKRDLYISPARARRSPSPLWEALRETRGGREASED